MLNTTKIITPVSTRVRATGWLLALPLQGLKPKDLDSMVLVVDEGSVKAELEKIAQQHLFIQSKNMCKS